VPLGGGLQRVASPDVPDARPVLGGVRVLDRELQVLRLEPFHDALDDLDDVERVLLELREEGQPAVADRAHLRVHRVALGERFGVGLRRNGVVVGEFLLVTPLVAVHVVPARCVLKARARVPVPAHRDGAPRLHRRELFLADVVRESAAVGANAPAKDERVDAGAVHQVGVVPVVDAGADDDRAAAVGLLGGDAPLACEADQFLAADAGEALRPRGGVDGVLVVVVLGVVALESARHAVLRHEQVVDGGDGDRAAIGRLEPANGDAARDAAALGEVVQVDLFDAVARVEEGERGIDFRPVHAVLELEVPLALLLLPAVPHRAQRHLRALVALVPHEELPVAVFFLGVVRQAIRAEHLPRLPDAVVLGQFDEEGAVGVLLGVVDEVGRLLLVVELLQEHMVDCHPPCAVLSRVAGHPGVRVFRDLAEVGGEDPHLRAVGARLGGEVHVRRAGHVEVGPRFR